MAIPVPSGTCDSVCGRGEAPKLPVHLLEAGHHLSPLSGAFPEHVSRTNSGGGGQQLGERGFAEHPCNAAPRYLGGSSHQAQPPLPPRDGFNGFQEKTIELFLEKSFKIIKSDH